MKEDSAHFWPRALDWCDRSATGPSRFYHPAQNTQVPIGQGARWAPEAVWKLWRKDKSLVPARSRNTNPWTVTTQPTTATDTTTAAATTYLLTP